MISLFVCYVFCLQWVNVKHVLCTALFLSTLVVNGNNKGAIDKKRLVYSGESVHVNGQRLLTYLRLHLCKEYHVAWMGFAVSLPMTISKTMQSNLTSPNDSQ